MRQFDSTRLKNLARLASFFVLCLEAMKTWQLQEAKNHLSEVVERAVRGDQQTITRHGKPAAVVMSVEQYRKLQARRGSLSEFFARSPLRGVELNLKRDKSLPREIKL